MKKLKVGLETFELKQVLWEIYAFLKEEGISPQDYDVVLFFISAHKDGLIPTAVLSDISNLKSNLDDSINRADKNTFVHYVAIYQYFEPLINQISDLGLAKIFQELFTINKRLLVQNFANFFEEILYSHAQSQGRNGGEYIQPVELTELSMSLVELPTNAKVFNPFAGPASYAVYGEKDQVYYGQEMNQKTWAIGILRLMAHEVINKTHYDCVDSIDNWPVSKKYDLVIANPPFGARLKRYLNSRVENLKTMDQFFVENGLNLLAAKGKLIAILPQGFLYRKMREQSLREYLIEEDLIDTIISFPGGLLLGTGIPFVILLINKDKKTPGQVRFVDAKNFVESNRFKNKILNNEGLNSLLEGHNQDTDAVRLIDNDQIKNLDYNLSVPRYFQKQVEGTKLREILEPVRGHRVDKPGEGKLIRLRDLKDDPIEFKLELSKMEKSDLKRHSIRRIDETCLILATRWKTLKPTYFEYIKEPIYAGIDIESFKVKSELADTAYLINELHSDYVQEQLESFRLGGTIPMIRRDDLLEVVIKLPSIEEQKAKLQGLGELSGKIKILQKERNALAHGKAARQFNEFASLKHTLGRPRQNILDWTDNLLDFLNVKPEGFDTLNKSFFDFYDTDILSALKEIKRDVNFMTDVLEKGENGFVVTEFDKTIISLSDVNKLIFELSSNGFNFKIKKLLLKGDKLKERGIRGNKTLLKTLIDNLLTNAHKYGFVTKVAGNEVVFELQEEDDFLSMEVRNSGKPFPKNFDREKFITKYSTADANSGSGLGGYDIHRIASEFINPEWELILNMDPIYPVKFKFKFPIKLIN